MFVGVWVVAGVAVGDCLVAELVAPRPATCFGSHELQQQQAWLREGEKEEGD